MPQEGDISFKLCDIDSCDRVAEDQTDLCYWHMEVPEKQVSSKFDSADIPQDLSGAYLEAADLSGLDLAETKFSDAELNHADFSEANLNKAQFNQSILFNVNFSNADLSEVQFTQASRSVKCKFEKSILNEADLSGSMFEEAIMNDLRGHYGDFSGCHFKQCNVKNAKLLNADLSETYLNNAFFSASDLSEADLHGSCIPGTDFSEAKLLKADLSNISNHHSTKSYNEFQFQSLPFTDESNQGYESVDFTDSNLNMVDLSKANLRNCDLRDATLLEADLPGTSLRGVRFSGLRLSEDRLVDRLQSIATQLTSSDRTEMRRAIDAVGIVASEHPALVTIIVDSLLKQIGNLRSPSTKITAIRALAKAVFETVIAVPETDNVFADYINEESEFVAIETAAAVAPIVIQFPNTFSDTLASVRQGVTRGDQQDLALLCAQILAVIAYNTHFDSSKPTNRINLIHNINNLIRDVQDIASESHTTPEPVREVIAVLETVADQEGVSG